MNDYYVCEVKMDASRHNKPSMKVEGSLNVVCAALTEAIKYPPFGLVSIEVKQVELPPGSDDA